MEILSNSYKKHALLKCMRHLKQVTRQNVVDLAHKLHGPNITDNNIPIVVLHGLLGSKKNWQSMSKQLSSATQKTVVAADARNHGESPHDSSHTYQELASDVSYLMRKLTINKAHVIGHSMGGRTAMVLALTEAEKVASLVVVDISPVSEAGLLNNFFPHLLDVMRSINFSGLDMRKAKTLAKTRIMGSGLVQHEALMDFIMMSLGRKQNRSLGWTCNVDALRTHYEDIAKFPDMSGKTYNGPTLFIAGDQSNYVPIEDFNGIKGYFPKADLKYVKGVGHNVHAEDPRTFLRMVTEFLAKNK